MPRWSAARTCWPTRGSPTASGASATATSSTDELNAALRRRPALEWEQELNAGRGAGRPDPHRAADGRARAAGHRGFFTEVPFPGGDRRRGSLRLSGNGVLVDGEPLHPQAPPPPLGEHNDDLEQLLQRCDGGRPWRAEVTR